MMSEEMKRKDRALSERKDEKDAGAAAEARKTEEKKPKISETWAEETIADLDDFIESQGIYIRQ